jgi:hypothetical protein
MLRGGDRRAGNGGSIRSDRLLDLLKGLDRGQGEHNRRRRRLNLDGGPRNRQCSRLLALDKSFEVSKIVAHRPASPAAILHEGDAERTKPAVAAQRIDREPQRAGCYKFRNCPGKCLGIARLLR